MARWQRERRQMTIIVTTFTAIFVFVLGIAAWALSDRYYQANLTPAATVQGQSISKRQFNGQTKLELVRLYQEYGVPVGFENDPQLAGAKSQYQDLALEHVVEHRVLDLASREAGLAPTPDQIDSQYQFDYGEFRVRHILIAPAKATDPKDQPANDVLAQQRARALSDLLKQSPNDQDLWNRLAKDNSDDPGTAQSGGELGWAGKGQYVAEFEDYARNAPLGQVSDPIKSQFGYHVIQVEERRTPDQTDLYKKFLVYGFGPADLKVESRYEWLKGRFTERSQQSLLVSPAEQVHVAKIVVNLPTASSGNYQAFLDALKKQSDIRKALDAGTDFAEVAKAQSEDADSKDKGGDVGWVARGMLPDPQAEQTVFGTEAGKITEPVSSSNEWTIYKVIEKAPSKDLDDDQKAKIKSSAYQYWLARQKKAYDVKKLVPGLSTG